VTQLGSAWVVIAGTMAVSLLLLVRGKTAGLVYAIATVGGGWFLGNVVVKNLIERVRPQGVALIDLPRGFSLPSGHALASFLLFATLAVIVVLNVDGRTAKVSAILGAVVLIGAVGASRVYLGVHWVGDVFAAWLFGGAWWAFTTATYLASVTERQRDRGERARP
jgi:undecaprenyl-diphosphatase